MKKICLIFLSVAMLLCASSKETNPKDSKPLSKSEEELIHAISGELDLINKALDGNENPWVRRYNSYLKYNSIINQIKTIEWRIKRTKPTPKNTEELQSLNNRLEALQRQKTFFSDYEGNPYKELTEIKEIQEVPSVTNPIAIFSGINFLKQIKAQEKTLQNNQATLKKTLALLDQKKNLLTQLVKLQDKKEQYNSIKEIQKAQSMKLDLQSAQSILETSLEVFSRRVTELNSSITNQIQKQTLKTIYIAILCLVIFFIALAIKVALRKYLDHERLYIANKIINFSYMTIIVLTVLLSYLSNITYLVTFLGFVSAGLAFAMRDLFMSVLGWFVIVIGGGLHAGDRIRIHRDNTTYVGDILDISMTRITLLEDVTLNTYLETRRAGRIIFIPNNFIFNTVISNYTHGGMTTIWDGIDFTITFDSNYKKAVEIATEVARKYSKPHTEIAKKRMSRLKERYSLKRISLEPRIFNMIEPNGMKISLWYQTNAFTTLNVRSSISGEIIDLLAKEKDIKIAYNTTKIVNTGSDGVWERFTHEEQNETKSPF
ncbi:mechanosensitive ion channel family protein [Helicobacter pametensis]|uniref:mechanosensitive ion channel family protein n=1 Tax=Helicobacter pametensis TaxID=95149 RepID=UPI0004AFB3BA|nr:mechanosensitive ion channel domain-containing protein [Helicobacter pametensis]